MISPATRPWPAVAVIPKFRRQAISTWAVPASKGLKASDVTIGSLGIAQQEGEIGIRSGGGAGGGVAAKAGSVRIDLGEGLHGRVGEEPRQFAMREERAAIGAAPLRGDQHVVVQLGAGQPGLPDRVHRPRAFH